jgi:hypothetical protein
VTADCVADKLAWKEKIAEAKRARDAKYANQEVFDIRILSDTTFPGSSHSSISLNCGKVLCSTPFGMTGLLNSSTREIRSTDNFYFLSAYSWPARTKDGRGWHNQRSMDWN